MGSAWEGIYESRYGYTFITPLGLLIGSNMSDWTWANINVTGNDWTIDPTGSFINGNLGIKSVAGSGVFVPKASMNGSYTKEGMPSVAWGPLTYSSSNALAITPANLQGKWPVGSTYGMSLEFDADGTFSGTTSAIGLLGACKLSGSLIQVTPGSAKNMFYLVMGAVDDSANVDTGFSDSSLNKLFACRLDTVEAYIGLAGIVFTPAGNNPQNGYFRTMAFNTMTEQGYAFTNYLRKQP